MKRSILRNLIQHHKFGGPQGTDATGCLGQERTQEPQAIASAGSSCVRMGGRSSRLLSQQAPHVNLQRQDLMT